MWCNIVLYHNMRKCSCIFSCLPMSQIGSNRAIVLVLQPKTIWDKIRTVSEIWDKHFTVTAATTYIYLRSNKTGVFMFAETTL